MIRLVLSLAVLTLPWLVGCEGSSSSAQWHDGSLSASWKTGLPTLRLHMDGGEAVEMVASRHELLGRSAFQSSSDTAAWRSELSAPGWTVTLVSVERPRGSERPVAAILLSTQRRKATAVIWCGAADTVSLEDLYAFLLRSPVEVTFDVKDSCGVLNDARGAVSRATGAELLRRVAQARAERSKAGPRDGRQWRLAEVVPQLDGNEPLQGAARVRGAGEPMVGVRVTFAREPHLACVATTDTAGVARCTMHDTHGHEPHDTGADPPPTVVTFAGRVDREIVDVPVVAVVDTPRPTRCLADVVAADVAASWSASCRGFASRTWAFPSPRMP